MTEPVEHSKDHIQLVRFFAKILTGGTIYGMTKTTVYLDAEISVTLRQLATQEGRPQAELIREALADYARKRKRPAIPGVGAFDSGHTDTAEQAENLLKEATARGKWR